MEALKDIFVPYEITLKLKEIGFDEPCVAGYCLCQGVHPMIDQMILNVEGNNGNYDISAPTYEQVKKWFREKGYFSTIKISPYAFYYGSVGMHKTIDLEQEDTYQQAQEQLIYKLIEIYK
ncbi:hypothetical protein CAPN001_11530 [Capnocytophaga stomatis]|uniref:hypothetical protein n=1 Tax=Capnocytophaga stomatis TaxID=1848904 RepID=UPI00194E29A0|nr:hypothetical protein [Capnocytophaga stomatis]GIJ96584.1 hypothetical protein CAPN001_11530 [Capnocytophaga stomatis]